MRMRYTVGGACSMPIDGQPAVRSCIPEMKQLGGTPGAGGGFVTVR